MSFFTYTRFISASLFPIRNVISDMKQAYPKDTATDNQRDILNLLIQVEKCLTDIGNRMNAEKAREAGIPES